MPEPMGASGCRDPDEERMVQWALRFVGYTARSEAEVRRRLEKAGCTDEMAERMIERLRRSGYLDDDRLARDWVESRSRSKRFGRARLRSELLRKGVAPEVADAALGQLAEGDELANLEALARQRLGSGNLSDPAVRRRLAGFLQRRGYDWERITEVFARLEPNVS